eukprot:GHVU01013430.1.p2 GENE.GHVU01013430.1~~GHVU01013430.1.p2  ORF type:complete len:111 (+),score=14.41 GHVU01013430.1:201-533(+)
MPKTSTPLRRRVSPTSDDHAAWNKDQLIAECTHRELNLDKKLGADARRAELVKYDQEADDIRAQFAHPGARGAASERVTAKGPNDNYRLSNVLFSDDFLPKLARRHAVVS